MLSNHALDLSLQAEIEIMRERLRSLPARWQEVLTRYYRDGQPAQEICAVMGLTESEFVSIKRRAKSRLGGIS